MGAIFGFTGPPDADLVERMSDALRHRGHDRLMASDARGTVGTLSPHDEPKRAKLGVGLSVDGANDESLVVSGFLLGDASSPLSPQTLLAEFRQRGLDFVNTLRGAFVMAIRDGHALHLIRDGLGNRTLYHATHQGRVLFASEPKAILAVPGFSRRLRPAAVAQYLTFSFIPGEGTMLDGLHEVPAGTIVTYDAERRFRSERWFRLEDHECDALDCVTAPASAGRCEVEPNGTVMVSERCARPSRANDGDSVSTFRDTFAQAVRERMALTRPPYGVFLSGGIDSSIVVAELARQAARPRDVHTFAIHFGERYPNELPFARAVAERCGTTHAEVLIRPRDFLADFRRIVWHMDEPIGDPITVPNFQLARHVAGHTSWIFNGEGGDPLFGGPKNIPMMLTHWYCGARPDPNLREHAYLASFRRGFDELDRLLTPEMRRHVDLDEHLYGIVRPYFQAERPRLLLHKLQVMNARLKGAHLILPKVERMLAAAGVTALAPLFDENIAHLGISLPPRLKLDAGVEKIALKRAYADALPREVIDRPKSGMRVPLFYWFRGEMKRYARHILSKRRVRAAGIFNEHRVAELLRYDGENSPARFGLLLWMLITFEQWRRITLVGEEP